MLTPNPRCPNCGSHSLAEEDERRLTCGSKISDIAEAETMIELLHWVYLYVRKRA